MISRVTPQTVFEAAVGDAKIDAGEVMVNWDVLRARDLFEYMVSPASPGGTRLTAHEYFTAQRLIRAHRRDLEYHLSRALPRDPAFDRLRALATPSAPEWALVRAKRDLRSFWDLVTLNWF